MSPEGIQVKIKKNNPQTAIVYSLNLAPKVKMHPFLFFTPKTVSLPEVMTNENIPIWESEGTLPLSSCLLDDDV